MPRASRLRGRGQDERATEAALRLSGPDRETRAREAAIELHDRARRAANEGDCARVARLDHQIETVDSSYHRQVFRRDERVFCTSRPPSASRSSAGEAAQATDVEAPVRVEVTPRFDPGVPPKDHDECQRWRNAAIRDANAIRDVEQRHRAIRAVPPCR